MVKKLPQNQVERLLDLVPYLTSKPGVSLEEIATDFQTSKSNVIDDLNTLWMCGLPGYTPLELIDLSFDTGFVSIRNADVLSKPRKLSNLELATVIVGLSILKNSISEQNSHYPEISNLLIRLSSSSNVPTPFAVDSKIDPELRLLAQQGIRDHQKLSISYFSYGKDVESDRVILPISLQVIDAHEYLESYCYTSKDFRMFRLDRIQSATLLDYAEPVSLQGRESAVLRNIFVKIISDPRMVSEIFNLHIPANFTQEDEFETTVFNDEWVIRTISSLKGAAVLSGPDDLRTQIKVRATKALELYS